jgi:hypothetical protein
MSGALITQPNFIVHMANRSFENVTELKYLGTKVINQNLVQEETKRILIYGTACNHFVFSSAVYKPKNYNIQEYNLAL